MTFSVWNKMSKEKKHNHDDSFKSNTLSKKTVWISGFALGFIVIQSFILGLYYFTLQEERSKIQALEERLARMRNYEELIEDYEFAGFNGDADKRLFQVKAQTKGESFAASLLFHNTTKEEKEEYLTNAVRFGLVQLVKAMDTYKGLDFELRDENSNSLICYAVFSDNYDMTKLLVEYLGYNRLVNIRNNKGWTPLHFAARWGLAVQVKLLVERGGADPNAKTEDGKLPIDFAYEYEPNSIGGNYRDIIHYLKNLKHVYQ